MSSLKVRNPVGKRGEAEAANFLREKGYHIVELNFRKNYTEIDLIVEDGHTTVFVLITTRVDDMSGTSFKEVTKERIQNVINTARIYLKAHRHLPKHMRVDAIGVVLSIDGEVEDIEHVENIDSFGIRV